MHHQLHLGVDVAADLEGSGLGKAFGKILAGGLFVGIEQTRNIDLVDEFVLVGESEAIAPIDGDLAGMKGAAALGDDMGGRRMPAPPSPTGLPG